MLTRAGAGQSGFSELPEYVDLDCVVSLPPGESLFRGQIVCRDNTQMQSPYGADIVILPANYNAGPAYGVYQLPRTITNDTAQVIRRPIIVRAWGQGVVIADGSSGQIAVGDPVITPPGSGARTQGAWGLGIWGQFLWGQSWGNNATAIGPGGISVVGSYIGRALATGYAGEPIGYVLIPNLGPAALINVAIHTF
jgi:hypothetical protein